MTTSALNDYYNPFCTEHEVHHGEKASRILPCVAKFAPDNQQPAATRDNCIFCGTPLPEDQYCANCDDANTQPPAPVGTPLPWKVADVGEHSKTKVRIVAEVGRDMFSGKEINVGIAEMLDSWTAGDKDIHQKARVNAALIVEAVNTYTTNQQRIRELEAALSDLVKWMDDSGHSKTKAGGKGVIRYEGHEYQVVTKARQVLNRGGER